MRVSRARTNTTSAPLRTPEPPASSPGTHRRCGHRVAGTVVHSHCRRPPHVPLHSHTARGATPQNHTRPPTEHPPRRHLPRLVPDPKAAGSRAPVCCPRSLLLGFFRCDRDPPGPSTTEGKEPEARATRFSPRRPHHKWEGVPLGHLRTPKPGRAVRLPAPCSP